MSSSALSGGSSLKKSLVEKSVVTGAQHNNNNNNNAINTIRLAYCLKCNCMVHVLMDNDGQRYCAKGHHKLEKGDAA